MEAGAPSCCCDDHDNCLTDRSSAGEIGLLPMSMTEGFTCCISAWQAALKDTGSVLQGETWVLLSTPDAVVLGMQRGRA